MENTEHLKNVKFFVSAFIINCVCRADLQSSVLKLNLTFFSFQTLRNQCFALLISFYMYIYQAVNDDDTTTSEHIIKVFWVFLKYKIAKKVICADSQAQK